MSKIKQPPKPLSRKLKINQRFVRRALSKQITIPEIRLCGKWLQEMGFVTGSQVQVLQERHRLVIRLCSR